MEGMSSSESHIFPFGDSVSVSAKGSWFALDVPLAHKSFWTHPMVTLGYKDQVEAHFGPFGDSANLVQDGCNICAERTIGSEINLDAPNGTRR